MFSLSEGKRGGSDATAAAAPGSVDAVTSSFEPFGRAPDPAADAASAEAQSSAGWRQRLAELDELAARPLAEHAEIYQGLHAELQAALTDIDGA